MCIVGQTTWQLAKGPSTRLATSFTRLHSKYLASVKKVIISLKVSPWISLERVAFCTCMVFCRDLVKAPGSAVACNFSNNPPQRLLDRHRQFSPFWGSRLSSPDLTQASPQPTHIINWTRHKWRKKMQNHAKYANFVWFLDALASLERIVRVTG